ncbi:MULTISPECIES: hypothetical protein [unclassified Okeania]|nr:MULTISPECIES: hypothetical protein [unclassified Okeania]
MVEYLHFGGRKAEGNPPLAPPPPRRGRQKGKKASRPEVFL